MTGTVWFITGSSRGLGRSVTEEALAAGYLVVATARRTTALDDLTERYVLRDTVAEDERWARIGRSVAFA